MLSETVIAEHHTLTVVVAPVEDTAAVRVAIQKAVPDALIERRSLGALRSAGGTHALSVRAQIAAQPLVIIGVQYTADRNDQAAPVGSVLAFTVARRVWRARVDPLRPGHVVLTCLKNNNSALPDPIALPYA